MPIARATLIFFILGSSLLLPSGLPAQEPPQDAQAALREIESMLAESSRVPPGAPGPPGSSGPPNDRLKVVSRIEKIVEHIESKPLPRDQSGWEILIKLYEYKVRALQLQNKISDARTGIDRLYPKLEACPYLVGEPLAMLQSRLLLMRQDLSFADKDWNDLEQTLLKLERCNEVLGATPEGAGQLNNIAIQSLRYLAFAKRATETEGIAKRALARIHEGKSISDRERQVMLGRLIDQVFDFTPQDTQLPGLDDWLKQANDIWLRLRDETDSTARFVAMELIAHRANLVTDLREQRTCWQDCQEWLRRDSFVALQDLRFGQSYIEANVRYLNRIDPSQFPSHLLSIHLFLDELQATPDRPQASPAGMVASHSDLAKLMRQQLRQGIMQRMTTMKRPAEKQIAPNFAFRRIDTGQKGAIADFQGKVLVLEFWHPSCGACLAGFETMSNYHRSHGNEDLIVMGCAYSYTEEREVDQNGNAEHTPQSMEWFRTFLAKRQVSYPMVLADDASVLEAYGVTAMPTFVVIDRQGKVVSYVEGMDEFRGEACQSAIKKALER
ncbi:MAG: TlpA family protein disulfide reductase [Pirellula sp.]|jgi:thiol-disulfide isomerase/thioredoxin|nr:TlpA family protein disulfide reductase [Pirellula sp.]